MNELHTLADEFMTPIEAAAYLKVAPQTVRNLIKNKRLPLYTFKNLNLIPVNAIALYRNYYLDKHVMTLYTRKNQYRGVNPHLISLQQIPDSAGRWKGYHHSYIENIHDAVNECLPPGYRAWIEDTVSIVIPPETHHPKYPDVLVGQKSSPISFSESRPATERAATPDLTLEMPYDTTEAGGVVIYKLDELDAETRGLPVTAIELLSPANKVSMGKVAHLQKREQLLKASIALVEIDLLHALSSPYATIEDFPAYPLKAGSKPFYIAITRPASDSTATDFYLFGINQPIPTVNIPLLHQEPIPVDLDRPYQTTFEKKFFGELVDYQKEPVRMDKYSENDRQAIREHMQKIITG